VTSGELERAGASFEEAQVRFGDASAASRSGLVGAVGWIPVLGRNIDVAAGVADAGVQLARAGTELVDAVRLLPDGLGSLAPHDGAIPVDAIAALGDDVAGAQARARDALGMVRDTPDTMLLDPVDEARFEAEREVARASEALTALHLTLQGLPGFAGADGERRYFFVAESPAEARGTGGIWGAYSILSVRDGRFRFSPFRPIQLLPDLDPDLLPAPNPDYRRNYDQYGGAGFWRNMNMTPDFPSAARAALNAYEEQTGERLDGVMSADPFTLQELLEVTGPTRVPGVGRKLDAETVVPFTANEAYIVFDKSDQRKEVLGDVAKGVFQRFLDMDEHDVARLRAVATSVARGHLKVYAASDQPLQDGLTLAGADGALPQDTGGDVAGVIVNSGSGSKVDYYASREVDYDVQLGGGGEAIATTEVRIHNDAPTSGVPQYVIGPLEPGGDPGDSVSLVHTLCATPCELLTAERNGTRISVPTDTELGIRWYQDFITIPAGTTGSLRVLTKVDRVWDGNSSAGRYLLTFVDQTAATPTHVRITIHAPAGQHITWTGQDMRVDGDTAVWEGDPGPRTEFEVRFSASLPFRLWRAALRPFGG
jgi:hypothetical protein